MSLSRALILAHVKGVGPVALQKALKDGVDEAARLVPGQQWDLATERASACQKSAQALGATLLVLGEPDYPDSLMALPDPPVVLYALGNVSLLRLAGVGVVGSRKATGYGLRVTRNIVQGLPSKNVAVISGMALGIDAAAHGAALDRGVPTIAVLGTGIDVPYPSGHSHLHGRIATHGLILAEAPPGTGATPGSFPRRNRILAALSDVLVVTEASHRSGALISARIAVQINRIVGAVPGPVDQPSCAGANALLRDGAHVVTWAQDVRALLHLTIRGRAAIPAGRDVLQSVDGSAEVAAQHADADGSRRVAPPQQPGRDAASPVERLVLSTLALGPRLPDELVQAAGASAREVSVALAHLSLRGHTATDAGGMVYLLNQQ